MRFAAVSDIHGNLAALEAVVHDIRRRGIGTVINLGDSLSGPLLPRETAQFLMASGWVHLAGNHERQVLTLQPGRGEASDAYTRAQLGPAELEWMAALTPAMPYGDGGEIFLCHATPRSDHEYFLETVEHGAARVARPAEVVQRLAGVSARVVLCGHTHRPRALIVNPGSVGLQAFDHDEPEMHLMENGSPDARFAVVERVGGDWLAALISVPYDFEPMALLAQQRGFADWAHALRTGYMPVAAG
jgi:predicted phosphodiesterase